MHRSLPRATLGTATGLLVRGTLWLLLVTYPPAVEGQPAAGPRQLPDPTGAYHVGRTVFHWIDSSRTEPFVRGLSDRRELMVYVWYPADAGDAGARPQGPYVPHIAAIARAIGDSLTRDEFGTAARAVLGGAVAAHAVDDASLASSPAAFPALLFSPGFGESSLTYSAQLTDLASHGFVVFAIEHPYDAFAVWFPDGRVVPFAAAAWDAAQGRPSGAVNYQLAQVPLRAADIRFTLDRVARLNGGRARENPFAGRLDLGRVAAFGHSLGGVDAASACRFDARLRACANEDADDDGRPWDGGPDAHAIKQPFLFFATGHSIYVSSRTPLPTTAALAAMKLTRTQYDSIVHLYQRNQDDALAAMPGGAIRVAAESNDFTHRSFMDLRLLQAPTDSAAAVQRHYLDLVRSYVLAFFDATLRDRPTALQALVTHPLDTIVTVRRFAPAVPAAAPSP